MPETPALYRRIVEALPEAMLVVDRAGAIRFGNARACRLFGYRDGELDDTTLDELLPERFRAEHAAQCESYHRAPRARPMAGRSELRGRRRDGSEFPVRVSLGPCELDDEQLVLCIVHDVREDDRLAMQNQAAQRLESVGRFACGIAHNVNNALTVVESHTDFLRDCVSDDPECLEDLDTIHQATRSAAEMTQQVLAFARQRAQKPESLQLGELVQEMHRLLTGLIGEDIELQTIVSEQLWPVRADRSGISQAIMNLASNARDAMPDGGRLTIETRNVVLDEAYSERRSPQLPPGEYVLLSMADTGEGIPDEVQPHVFEPFFTTKGSREGTGLGLATVYGFVKQSDGYIWVYSEAGRGTAFKIYLPRGPQEQAARGSGASAQPRAPVSGTVLLVEDDDLVRRSAARILRRAGYGVIEANGPGEALDRWNDSADEVDLVLSDFGMPEMNGAELVTRLRAERASLPVVLMSGYGPDASGAPAAPPPDIPFVQKPFSHSSLVGRIAEVLAGGSR